MKSDDAGLPETGENAPNGHDLRALKCVDCLMALYMDEGIWCLKFKGLADDSIAKNCEDFVGKDLVYTEEGDASDEKPD
ncbi:MAG: hypothetical protein MN733_36970 [Nitrososphaera sp.]|nr:hypothetical protein [Nitrososphaera sp.]